MEKPISFTLVEYDFDHKLKGAFFPIEKTIQDALKDKDIFVIGKNSLYVVYVAPEHKDRFHESLRFNLLNGVNYEQFNEAFQPILKHNALFYRVDDFFFALMEDSLEETIDIMFDSFVGESKESDSVTFDFGEATRRAKQGKAVARLG